MLPTAVQPTSLLDGLLTRDPRVQYPSALSLSPFGVLTEPDPAGSLLSEQRTVLVMPEPVRGLLEGIAAPNQVRQGKMDPMTGAMLTAGAAPAGSLLVPKPVGPALGMNVFQGGPHRYGPEGAAKSLDYIGKGEGAQAYGWGRYDAGAQKVGQLYKETLAKDIAEIGGDAVNTSLTPSEAVDLWLFKSQGMPDELRGMVADKLNRRLSASEILDDMTVDGFGEYANDVKKLIKPTKGYLYKHDLPDEDIARYLDWDAPLSEQPESVRAALEPLGFKADPQGLRDYDKALLDALYNDPKKALPKLPADPTGAEIYQSLVDKSGALDWPVGSDRAAREAYRKSAKQAASEALGKAGIPGLKYYDGMSRNAGEGTRNFVTWDQDVLDRMKLLQRNDETFFSNARPAAAAGGLLNQAAQSDARRITVPEDRQGLIWTPMSAGEKNVTGGELSKTAPLVDSADMSATVVPTGDMQPRTIVQPENLQGSILRPAVGDRTAAGGLLTEINDAPLANPVLLEGGPDFMRGPASQADDVIWASNQSPMTNLSRHAQELGETGKDINFVYTASGGRNADFATMMSDALIEQLPAAKVTKKTKQSFDREMKVADENWPGIDSPKLGEYLRNSTGNKRKAFVEKIALGKYQKAGMPDIVSTRFAITEPELLGRPTGASGYAISRMDPSGRLVTDPTVPHTTYPVQLGGKGYVGGLLDNVPREVMFPDFYATRRAAGIPTRGDDYSFGMSNVSQDADQQWLDNVMQYLQGIQQAN
jgi:hypothetical protein